jgi:hypothetical protein
VCTFACFKSDVSGIACIIVVEHVRISDDIPGTHVHYESCISIYDYKSLNVLPLNNIIFRRHCSNMND